MRESTAKQYRNHIEWLFKRLTEDGTLDEIAEELPETGKHLLNHAIKDILKHYKIDIDVSLRYVLPKGDRNAFTREEAEAVLNFIKTRPGEKAERDYYICKTLLETGMAPGALVGHNGLPGVDAFKYHELKGMFYIEYVSRGGAVKWRPVSEDTYMRLKGGLFNRTDGFGGKEDVTMGYTNLYYIVRDYINQAAAAGVIKEPKKKGPTMFTFCPIDRYGVDPADQQRIRIQERKGV